MYLKEQDLLTVYVELLVSLHLELVYIYAHYYKVSSSIGKHRERQDLPTSILLLIEQRWELPMKDLDIHLTVMH